MYRQRQVDQAVPQRYEVYYSRAPHVEASERFGSRSTRVGGRLLSLEGLPVADRPALLGCKTRWHCSR